MSVVSHKYPILVSSVGRIEDQRVRTSILELIRNLENLRDHLSRAISLVEIEYVKQTSQPTPDEGRWVLWRDTDASPGQPLAYLVTRQDGEVFTFPAREVA